MANALSDAIQSALSGVTVISKDGSTFKFSNNQTMIKQNQTYKAGEKVKAQMNAIAPGSTLFMDYYLNQATK
jgi:hypothetical protein